MLLKIFRFLTYIYKIFSGIQIGYNSVVNPLSIIRAAGSEISIGKSSIVFGSLATMKRGAKIHISNGVYIGKSSLVAAKSIVIEKNTLISSNCFIADNDGHSLDLKIRRKDVINRLKGSKKWSQIKVETVKICKDSWIGYGSIILKGVTIGEGSIVGAGSVVTSSVPPFTVVAGNPATIIKRIKIN